MNPTGNAPLPKTAAKASRGTDSHRLSVMTLNLRFGLADDGPNSWSHRKPRISALFADHRPDWIAFQEANGFQIDDLVRILDGYQVIGRRRPAPDFWQNNVIFFRAPWQCIFSDHFFLSHTPDLPSRFAESRWPRQYTIGVFEHDSRRIAAVNTHFDFDETVQEKSAKLVLARLENAAGTLPAVLMGDFNAAPGSAPHRVFTDQGRGRQGAAHGFSPVFTPPYPGTHHAFSQ